MAKRFDGKVVFITGASSGIGAAMALEFARAGARVALAARRADRLEEVRKRVNVLGGQAIAVPCDVRDRASLDGAVARVIETFGQIDVAIANAGFGVVGPFDRLNVEAFRRQFETNVFGVIDTIYAVLPHLIASKGRLGIVSSVMGRLGAPANAPYAASKFAVCGLAESLYYELAAKGVAVTCILPGIIESDIRKVDNCGVYHADRTDPAPKWIRVPAERAARPMVRAVYKRRFEAVITAHGKAAIWFSRHFPRSFRALYRIGTRNRLASVQERKRARAE